MCVCIFFLDIQYMLHECVSVGVLSEHLSFLGGVGYAWLQHAYVREARFTRRSCARSKNLNS